jgi:2-polyprenyl-6-hydroxyphenyl methylase/3-demethylubiquinone-9 3-methyltransferase
MTPEARSFGWSDAEATCAHAYLLPVVFAELARRGAGPMRLVDIGCGNGYVTAKAAELGHEAVGIDVAEDGIAIARAAHPAIRFELASVYDERLPESIGGKVDAVLALEVIEHLYCPRSLFRASHELLRDGGLLVVSTPYHGYLKNLAISAVNGWDRHFTVAADGGHIKFFSRKSLTRMALECGFRNPRVRGVGRVVWLWKSMILAAEK